MKYQLLRPLTDRELSELRLSIQEFGIQQPVLLDENGDVLDGHHRRRIADEMGAACPTETRAGLDEEAKRRLILGLNEARRHLGRDEKRQLAAELLKAAPERSDRQIAAEVGVHQTTVGSARKALEHSGDVSKLDTSTDTLGRKQPRERKPTAATPPPAPAASKSITVDRDLHASASRMVEFYSATELRMLWQCIETRGEIR